MHPLSSSCWPFSFPPQDLCICSFMNLECFSFRSWPGSLLFPSIYQLCCHILRQYSGFSSKILLLSCATSPYAFYTPLIIFLKLFYPFCLFLYLYVTVKTQWEQELCENSHWVSFIYSKSVTCGRGLGEHHFPCHLPTLLLPKNNSFLLSYCSHCGLTLKVITS